jgi:hypothetical protein
MAVSASASWLHVREDVDMAEHLGIIRAYWRAMYDTEISTQEIVESALQRMADDCLRNRWPGARERPQDDG